MRCLSDTVQRGSSPFLFCCYIGDDQQKAAALAKTVQSVLAIVADNGLESVAIPLIGGGKAGCPTQLAAQNHVEEAVKSAKVCHPSWYVCLSCADQQYFLLALLYRHATEQANSEL